MRRVLRAGAGLLLSSVLLGCGSESQSPGSGSGGAAAGGSSMSAGGSHAAAGKSGSDTGGTGSAGAGTVAPSDCGRALPARAGAVSSAISPEATRLAAYASDVSVACDGSFVVTGEARGGLVLERADGAPLELESATAWVAKLDARGGLLWANPIPQGAAVDSTIWSHAAVFPDGSVVVGGVFGTRAVFGQGEPNETELVSGTADQRSYIVRYGVDGSLAWVRPAGAGHRVQVQGVAAAPDGSTYVALENANLPPAELAPGELDVVLEGNEWAIVKLDASGSFVGALVGTKLESAPVKLLIAADGGLMVAGRVYEGALVGKDTAAEQALASPGLFLAHTSADLQLDWARMASVSAQTRGAALLPDGGAVLVGTFSSSLTLGKDEPGEVTFMRPASSAADKNGFVARLDAAGKLSWAVHVASADNAEVYGAAVLPDGTTWVSGIYGAGIGAPPSTLELAAGTPRPLTASANALTNFVARLSPDGVPEWITQFEDESYLHIQAIAAAPEVVVAAGMFDGTASFGSSQHQLEAITSPSVFITRLGP